MGTKKKRHGNGGDAPKRTSGRGKKVAPKSVPSAERATDEESEPAETSLTFSVVGIGASAGGLDAFTQLLRALPVDTGMAFVLVQHLSPNRPSALAEILSRATSMPVEEVVGEPVVEPNRVYVIPPDQTLSIEHGRLHLRPREAQGKQHPIDQFFLSLAKYQRHLAIGVVLSGTATDGTLGLEEIKAEGGITFAQDATAQQSGMPQSAAASGCVDFVLPPEAIAAEIARVGQHPMIVAPQSSGGRGDAQPESAPGKSQLAPILDLLRTHTGVDFTLYKVSTLQRRIGRRMVLQQQKDIRAYAAFARENRGEIEVLYQDLLINVTSFFRDPEVFAAIEQKVIPRLLEGRARQDPLRVWVLGCSTGEEAYSYAMILSEVLESTSSASKAQVFATDLNTAGIARARAGTYAKERLADVSRERIRRHFVEQDGSLHVSKAIRAMCVFSPHNVLEDPPFSRMDIVSCRNLMIYLEPELQQRIIPLLHYALKPAGVLVLGSSESIGRFGKLFAVEDGKHKLFLKKPGSSRVPYMSKLGARPHSRALVNEGGEGVSAAHSSPTRMSASTDAHKEAERLLAFYAPPAVLVDAELEILQFRGNTEPFLAPAQGRASHALLKMARKDLLVPLQALLHRAKQEKVPVREVGLHIESLGEERELCLEILPMPGTAKPEGCLLVLFIDARRDSGPRVAQGAIRGGAGTPGDASASEPARADEARLEQELANTREHLQALMEEFEATNEELQSSNEEAQSANEELQSINEELETSKEEIESSNEELTTLNEELRNRNAELGQLNSDLTNLISSVHLAVVIVGRDLCIRRFSPLAERLLSIIPGDVGRPLTDIRMKLVIPDLEALLTETIDTITPSSREIKGDDGRWYSVRVRPYVTVDNKVDGAVLSLIDIDAIRRAREYSEAIVATVREPLLVLDANLRIQSAGRAFYEAFQLEPSAVEGHSLYELDEGKWDIPTLRRLLADLLARDIPFDAFRVEREFAHIGRRIMLINARRLQASDEEPASILLAFEDITIQDRLQSDLKFSESRYRRLFESAKDGILMLDAASATITDANPALSELLGQTHAELLGKELWEIGLFQSAEATGAVVKNLQSSGYVHYEDLPLKTSSGRSIDVEFVSSVYTQGVNPVIQCNLRDITERKRLEFDLARRVEELALADAAKNHFLAALSHELRSPLNILLLWSQIISETGVSEETLSKGLDIIRQTTRAQTRLIQDLLDVHRISSGKLRLELAATDLAEVLSEVVDSMLPLAAEKGLSLECELELSPAYTSGDAARLQQVFRNLIDNSIKFTPKGGSIHVRLCRKDASAEIAVIDTGIGLSAARLASVFHRFAHADPLTSHANEGLGLGLVIVRQLVELHGGSLAAESPGEGAGATFTVSLPLREESAPSKPSRAPKKRAAARAPRSLRGTLVLVVEDDARSREAVRLVLEAAGARTVLASSTDEALESLRRERPDAIVSDIGMPGRDGYDFMRALRELPVSSGGRIPAIALTAYTRPEDRERALAAGYQDHLPKPVEAMSLIATLAAQLARKRARSSSPKAMIRKKNKKKE
jgi:two-component system CheB/CheR fusion protein